MRRTIKLALAAAVAALATTALPGAQALDNGLARVPQMGWNSWNKFACDVSDTLIRQTAEALVTSGLAKLGYNYVNIDDCWQVSRDANGVIVADPQRFPNGIPALAAYVHSLGLKFGLYSDAGEKTCQGRPGGLGHEVIDAQTYAAWKVDYLKYDNCFNDNIKPEVRYPPMRDALNATGWPVFFSMCEWGVDSPWDWAPKVGNSWRTTADIKDTFDSMYSNIVQNDQGWHVATAGGWNDPDMLEIGNGNMTNDEYTMHFSLWALAKAPLIIGCDVREMDKDTMRIISNAEVIAVNQDALGVQGHRVIKASSSSKIEVWAGPQASGALAVVVVNLDATATATYTLQFGSIGAAICNDPRDLWLHAALPEAQGSVTLSIAPHGSRMLLLTPCRGHSHGAQWQQEQPQQPALEQPKPTKHPRRRHHTHHSSLV